MPSEGVAVGLEDVVVVDFEDGVVHFEDGVVDFEGGVAGVVGFLATGERFGAAGLIGDAGGGCFLAAGTATVGRGGAGLREGRGVTEETEERNCLGGGCLETDSTSSAPSSSSSESRMVILCGRFDSGRLAGAAEEGSAVGGLFLEAEDAEEDVGDEGAECLEPPAGPKNFLMSINTTKTNTTPNKLNGKNNSKINRNNIFL